MESLLRIRSRATEILAVYLALHVPVIAMVAWLLDKPWLAPTLGAVVIAAVVGGMAIQMRQAPATRYTLAAGLMGMVSIILFAMSGEAWQIDVHMYYFAGLAMVAAFCCWRTVLVAAGVVAVHHLTLNFLLPSAVFPDGANLIRVILHAVIVVFEAAVLLWLTSVVASAFQKAEDAISQVEAANAERARLAAEKEADEAKAQEARHQVMLDLATQLESSVGSIASTVSAAAEELDTTARALSESTQRVGTLSERVASEAEGSNREAKEAESSVGQMSSAIDEIARHVDRASEITRSAVERVRSTDSTVAGLSDSAERIGDVITLIQGIAEQTNLLALNATIEAARAGDAGKGFAVVANEVKSLANQTGQATSRISGEIEAVRRETRGAVDAIRAIGESVTEIDEVSAMIAGAIEEQTAVTRSLADQIRGLAQSSEQAATAISEVARDSRESGSSADNVHRASGELTRHADTLRQQVNGFLGKIRSA